MPEMPSSGSFLTKSAGTPASSTRYFCPTGVVEQAQQLLAVFVVDVDDHVGVLHVVDPRHVLVANALDAVPAEAVLEQRGALERLADGQFWRADTASFR